MELHDKIILKSKDGDEFTVRRLLKTDKEHLQKFGESLSEVSTATFLPHSYDDDTVNAYLERSETGEDLT